MLFHDFFPNSPNEFRDSIAKLFKNNKLKSEMGNKARKLASTYNSEKVVVQYIKEYEDIIKNYKPSKASIKNLNNILKNRQEVFEVQKGFKFNTYQVKIRT